MMETVESSKAHSTLCNTASQTITSTDALRAKLREYVLQERSHARAAVCDGMRFGLGEIKAQVQELENLTEKDVHGLGTRIKRRKHATVEDMYRLSHAFLQSNENINAFANMPGALQVIVKELTGTDSDRQVYAAECLCNLSLGESHVCEKVSNAAGSYLVTYLDSSEERLKRTSLWTLANLLDTSNKAAQILLQMELIRKLWTNYVSNTEDYCEDAAICLERISVKCRHILNEHDYRFIANNLASKNPTGSAGEYHLKIIFNFGIISPERQLEELQIQYLVNYALSNLQNSIELTKQGDCLRVVFAVRVLANMLACQNMAYDIFLKQLGLVWQSNLIALFNKLFMLPQKSLISETLWFLKNVIEKNNQHDGLAIESLLKKISLPREILMK